MVILVDTNIVIDVIVDRQPYAKYARKILSALDNDSFVDFEDCLQEECAVEVAADFIVTRNPGDFASARVNVITPDVFLSKY